MENRYVGQCFPSEQAASTRNQSDRYHKDRIYGSWDDLVFVYDNAEQSVHDQSGNVKCKEAVWNSCSCGEHQRSCTTDSVV